MKIFQYKTDLMRELIRLVSHGYISWCSGSIEPKKAEGLMLKFHDRYAVNATSQQRYRRKTKDQANARLLMCLDESGESVLWWLVATSGEGLVHQLETLMNATEKKTRLEITGYELVKTPRSGRSAQWTWRMTKETELAWKERIRTAIRGKHQSDELIQQALYSLRRVPGFAESRRQAFSLVRFAQGEWKRHRRSEWPYPDIFVGWVGQFKKPQMILI